MVTPRCIHPPIETETPKNSPRVVGTRTMSCHLGEDLDRENWELEKKKEGVLTCLHFQEMKGIWDALEAGQGRNPPKKCFVRSGPGICNDSTASTAKFGVSFIIWLHVDKKMERKDMSSTELLSSWIHPIPPSIAELKAFFLLLFLFLLLILAMMKPCWCNGA